MSVAQKLSFLIVTALGALLIMALAGFWQARQLDHSLEFISTDSMPSVIALEEVQAKFWQMRTSVWQHVAYRKPSQKQDAEARFDKQLAEVDALVDQYDKNWGNETIDKAAIAEIRKSLQDYREYCRGLFLISKTADTEQTYFELMASINSSGKTVADSVLKAVSDQMQRDKDEAAASVAQSRQLQQRLQLFCAILLVSIFAFLGFLGLMLYRGIIGPLHSARDTLNHIENHLDFTVRAQVIRNDEIGQMMTALNSLLSRTQSNLREIAQGAGRVADSAMALVSNAQQVSQGSARQSEVAADMATSMEEMAVSIGHVADRASETSLLSRQAGEQAHDGIAMIGQTQQDISEISRVSLLAEDEIAKLDTQTTRINEVVTIIREVAEQTNLLALNAAIEAARAGESGRGFAVVADEIRKLAERTATSTRQIAGTVGEIRDTATRARAGMGETVTLVSDSVTRASEAAAAITQIGEGAQQTRTMISEISDSIHEQRAASENVAAKVEVIAQMAEENSAAAANTAESARHLDELAHGMRQIVLQYRV